MQNGSLKYAHQRQRVSEARRWLMAPHHQSEAEYFAGSYGAFSIGMMTLDEARLAADPNAESAIAWIASIREIFTLADGEDALQRARRLTEQEKSKYAQCIDELASWFESELYPPSKR